MTENEKQQLVVAVITQLKSEGTDVSNADIVSNANGIDYVVAYGKNGQIVRAVPTAISSEKVGASGYMNAYTEAGVYNINTNGGEDLPIDNQGAISARLTVLVTESGGNKVITQVLNLNNNVGGEGNIYIRACKNGEWKAWGKLQTNVEVGQVNTLDNLTDNGIYSGVFTDGTPTSVGTFYDTFVLIVINNYAVSIPTGNPQSISQLKYSLGLDGSISVASRKRDQYGYWDEWVSLDEKSLVEEEKSRAEQVEQAIKKKLDDEIERSITADQVLLKSITEETRRANEAEEAIKNKAVEADSLNFQTRANVVALDYKTIEGVGDEITIPAATTEMAGVMSATDKDKLDSIEIINDLITGGAYKVLSAEMGKELNSKAVLLSNENLTKYAKNGYYTSKNEFVESSEDYVIRILSVNSNTRFSLSNITSFVPGGAVIVVRDNLTKNEINKVFYSNLNSVSENNYIYDLAVENGNIYTVDIYYGNGNGPSLNICANQVLSETFDNKVDLIEYSVVEKGIAIKSNGEIISNGNYKCYKIRNKNFSLIVGQANTYKGFLKVAFYNGEPSQSTFISGSVQSAGDYRLEQYTLVVPTDCEYILVCESKTVYAGDSSCFIYSNLNQIFKTEKKDVTSIQSELKSLNNRIVGAENSIGFILDKEEPIVKTVIEDFTIDGYYQNSGTEVTPGYDYISAPLITVNEGDTVYLHNWKEYTDSSVGVIWCYDNDNKPYNGNNARITANKLMKISDGEYQFIIPSNCSQIGISIAPQYPEDAYMVVGDDTFKLTKPFKELIESSIVVDENTGDKTAKYYLKGNSNIAYSSSKKLGIIAAGQSNIDGRNSYSDLPSDFVNPNSKVHFCNNVNGVFSEFQIRDGGSSNDWSFDAIVYDLLTNPSYGNQSEIYVMKKSMGGTSIDKDGATDYHWTADYEYLASESYSLLRSFEKTIRKAVELQGDKFEIKAFVWHQGEGDTVSLEVANKYYDNLKNMLAYIRGIVGNPRLHFFCGSISKNNTASTYKDIINEAYFKLASEDAYFHLVDLSEAVLEDSWHFNYEWSIYFGKMVYDLMIDCGIIEGVKVNPEKPS